MSKDRRRYMRFDIALEVTAISQNYSDELFSGKTKNFSRSGLCFESGALNPVLDRPMKLKVKLPNLDTFISVSGNVAWKEQRENRCLVGIEFSEIDKEAKVQILDYAYDLWVQHQRETSSSAPVTKH